LDLVRGRTARSGPPSKRKVSCKRDLSKGLYTYFALAGSVVACCHNCVAVRWGLALARRADRLGSTYRPCWIASYPRTHTRPRAVSASVVPRWRRVRRHWVPGEQVALFVCCCAERVGQHARFVDCGKFVMCRPRPSSMVVDVTLSDRLRALRSDSGSRTEKLR